MDSRNCGYCKNCGAGNYDACTTLQPSASAEPVQEVTAPTVEQAIETLKRALRDSKGWTLGYAEAIIRDAIDRVPAAREQEAGCAACVTCGQPWPEASATGAEPSDEPDGMFAPGHADFERRQIFTAPVVGSWPWLRGCINGIPKREEFIGGQRAKYVALDEVLSWIDEGERRAASASREPDLDGRLPDRLEFSSRVPENVMAALNRMCSPLDPTRLSGFTAEQDAKCMALIRSYVLGDDNQCASCVEGKCVTGPQCVTLGRDS